MLAMGRYIKETVGEKNKIVFIGPCTAKKAEILDESVAGVIDEVLTFVELKEILHRSGVTVGELDESPFDPPHAFMGKSYPLAGGLLKTADLPGDVLEKEIIVVEGEK